jgi:hypothetical protein
MMAERKRDEKDEKEEGELRPIVGTPGATPKLSADPQITTTPVTVSGEQAGGTILLDTGQVVYTNAGAVPAVPGGPPDPTIIPGQFPENDQDVRDVRMVDRGDVPDAPAEKK